MKIIVIRHADAGDREAFAAAGKPDNERPLTGKGKKQMRGAAAGLRSLLKRVDVIASSPLVRATQTAEIVAKEYPKARREMVAALAPSMSLETFVAWAATRKPDDHVIAVGHEPHLGELVTWLTTSATRSGVEFRKGGAALVTFDTLPSPGHGTLEWLMGPKELRALS